MRLRRRHGLVCYWYDGSFVVHPYPGGDPLALHPAVAEILSAFSEWTDPAEAAEKLNHLSPGTVEQAVGELRGAGLLLAADAPEVAADERFERQWSTWSPEAAFFHYATQDVKYPETEHEGESAAGRESQAPFVLFTSYPRADRILLPRPLSTELRAPYEQVLLARHTCRDYTRDPVPLPVLSTLLATAFAPVDFIDCGRGALFRRTSPAGGARQELDAYVAVRNVTGVEPGVYHYNLREHSLELLSEGFSSADATRFCADQEWAGGAAFLVVLGLVVDRLLSKYPTPRSYRVSLLNAGHLGQTFALTATALGLGPAQTGAFHDSQLAERLGLDNIGRTPLYVLAAGHPAAEQPEAPPAAGLSTFRETALEG
ncbi:SagB-type dehydrogenase family enzyme [Actinopolyspora biskrensis]|uniref:SagB-type dehydrogenase family enzyme n=1 Tax=Actinopolyspora biskrensis TaxID=1470178 RepID=A0A852Z4V9_9ACTN|nr:SagB/ThcOx family dehydrogenase [Actinopolyspora biskrensis]NYH80345.1 SagB-type dehydrogenase family enzyme [Actinopolyspora biskrensis]